MTANEIETITSQSLLLNSTAGRRGRNSPTGSLTPLSLETLPTTTTTESQCSVASSRQDPSFILRVERRHGFLPMILGNERAN